MKKLLSLMALFVISLLTVSMVSAVSDESTLGSLTAGSISVEVNGEEYRVPGVVIAQVKDILEENKNMKSFKVKRTGEGKTGTRYTVIPLS